jgi:hypothetical protein
MLPHSKQSEEAFMWACIIDNSILNITKLKQDDFYDTNLWKIYNLCKILKDNNKNIDLVVLSDVLEKKWKLQEVWGMMYLVELTENAQSHNWKEYEEIIKNKSDRRKIIQYARRMEMTARDEWEETKKAIEGIETISNILFREDEKGDIIDLVDEYDKIRQNFNRQGALWEPTVFPIIDKYTQGAIKWSVCMICAYSNVWKSAISYAYACDFLKKWKKVLYFSLEVTRGILMTNILRCYYKHTYPQIMDEEYYFNMDDFEKLKVYDNKTKLEEIKNITRIEKPDVVFIDFVQNIEGLGMSEYENMTRCAKEIQSLAIETNTTIFPISQVWNDSRFKSETMQPKGSWQLFFSSDVIVWLYKDWNSMYAHLIKNKYWQNDKKFLIIPDFRILDFKISEDFKNDDFSPNL